MSDSESSVPAGWYDDPSVPHARRYWDGNAWTRQLQPKAPGDLPPSPVAVRDDSVPLGWAVAGFVLAVLIPVLGLAIGFWLRTKRGTIGFRIIMLSLLSGLIYWRGWPF